MFPVHATCNRLSRNDQCISLSARFQYNQIIRSTFCDHSDLYSYFLEYLVEITEKCQTSAIFQNSIIIYRDARTLAEHLVQSTPCGSLTPYLDIASSAVIHGSSSPCSIPAPSPSLLPPPSSLSHPAPPRSHLAPRPPPSAWRRAARSLSRRFPGLLRTPPSGDTASCPVDTQRHETRRNGTWSASLIHMKESVSWKSTTVGYYYWSM